RTMSRTRVLLADDHTIFLDALTKLLEPEFEVVGTATDGRTLVSQAANLKPDVVVLDIGMPLLNGLDAGQQVKDQRPETRLIFLTQNQDPNLAAEAYRRKASGYLLKNSAATELVTAIREAMRGRTYVSPLIADVMLSRISEPTQKDRADLTPRQREVLQLLAEGKSMKEVATILNLSTRTVEFHKQRIMELLDLKTNADLIRYAVKEGLV
ncbi:MAG TPA: response regulator transcription factor, partial [Terriglobales bacterium]